MLKQLLLSTITIGTPISAAQQTRYVNNNKLNLLNCVSVKTIKIATPVFNTLPMLTTSYRV